jgi:hypothetical protein
MILFWGLFEPVSDRDRLYRNSLTLFVYSFKEIYLRSLFLNLLHVMGFSSQRITLLNHFLSSVWQFAIFAALLSQSVKEDHDLVRM